MFELFYSGGPLGMSVLTIILLALLLAAWKAPAWVKEIGLIALVGGIIFALIGFFHGAKAVTAAGGITQAVAWGALGIAVIAPIYGLFIYLVSLVIRIIQKPRI